MKVSDKIIPEIKRLFTIDDNAVPFPGSKEYENFVEFENELERIKDLVKGISGEGSTLAEELEGFLENKEYSALFAKTTGGTSEALLIIVSLANTVPEKVWDDNYNTLFDDFVLHEVDTLECVYNSKGTRIRTQISEKTSKATDAVSLLDLREINTPIEITQQIDFDDLDGSNEYIISTMISLLSREKRLPITDKCWVSTKNSGENDYATTIKYQAVLNGNIITFPHKHKPLTPHSDILGTISASVEYTQYNEPIEMLGEINSKTSIIEAFLSSYHVLENYMLRARIAEVTGQISTSNQKFRIRDFKRLEIAVDHKEMLHLKNLIEKCKGLSIGGTVFTTALEDFRNRMTASPDYSTQDMDEILRRLSIITKTGNPVDINNNSTLIDNIHKIIYMIRCSIVHNKETEFHISNKELANKNLSLLICELAIPIMQKLAFGLPSVSNGNPIDYKTRNINLY